MLENDDMRSSSSSSTATFGITQSSNKFTDDKNLYTINKPSSKDTFVSSQTNINGNNEQLIFELSKPFNSFHNNKNKLIKNNCSNFDNYLKNNTNFFSSNNNLFEFNEPIELNSQFKLKYNKLKTNLNGSNQRNHIVLVEQSPFSVFKSVKSHENIETQNNVVVINTLRNHPYNNSIRPTLNENLSKYNDNNSLKINQTVNESTNSNESNLKSSVSSLSTTNITNDNINKNNLNVGSINSNNMNRNRSSNAILAHLKSLSPNFKSIFVRPKSSKHIESSSILNKSKLLYNHKQDKSILPLYNSATSFDATSTTAEPQMNNNGEKNRLLNLMSIVPNIEPKELRLNSSVDELLKKFATENDVLSDTIKSITTGANSTMSLLKTTSKLNESIKNTMIFNKPVTSTSATGIHNHHINIYEKWTCMICLSKHAANLDICSICGSSKPTSSSTIKPNTINNLSFSKHYSSNTSPTSSLSSTSSLSPSSQVFSSYLLNELGLKHKLDQQQIKISTNSSSSSINLNNYIDNSKSSNLIISPHRNPYLKKWTCIHCNYSNDSLKVVCLNCRWLKTTPKLMNASFLKQSPTLSEDNNTKISCDSTPSKRAKSTIENNHESSNDSNLNLKQSSNCNNLVCSSCKSPLNAETNKNNSEKTSTSSSQETVVVASTPIKAVEKSNSLTSSIGSFSSSKWTCETCLVQNNDLNEKCVCCATPKPGSKLISSNITSSLSSNLSTTSSSKWTCDICLVKNDADKSKCICCSSDKPSESKKTIQPTLQSNENKPLTAFPSIKPSMPVSTSIPSNIKFGLPSSTPSTVPISFGSSLFTVSSSSPSNMLKSSSEPIKFGALPLSKTTPEPSSNTASLFKTSITSSDSKQESLENNKNSNISSNNIFGISTSSSSSTFSGFSFKPLEQTNKPINETINLSKPNENYEKKNEDNNLPKLNFGNMSSSNIATSFQIGDKNTNTNANTMTGFGSNNTLNKNVASLQSSNTLRPFPASSTPNKVNEESKPAASFSLYKSTLGSSDSSFTNPSQNENNSNKNFSFDSTQFGKPALSLNNSASSVLFNFPSTNSNIAAPSTLSSNKSDPFKPTVSGFTGFGNSNITNSKTSSNNELPKLNFGTSTTTSNLFGMTSTNKPETSLFNTNKNSNNNLNQSLFSTTTSNTINSNSSVPTFNFAQNNTSIGANTSTTTPFSFKSPTNTSTAITTSSFLPTTITNNTTPTTSLFSTNTTSNSIITPPSNPVTQFNTPSTISAPFGSITTPPSSIGGIGLSNDLGQPNKMMLNNQTPSFGSNFNFNINPNFNFADTQNGIMQFSGGSDSNTNDVSSRKFRRAKRTNR